MKEKLTPAAVFTVNGKATPKHDEMLLIFNKDSKKLMEWGIIGIQKKMGEIGETFECMNKIRDVAYIKTNDDGTKSAYREWIANYKERKELSFFACRYGEIKITKWEAEKPIMSRNYYLGSVDLYVEFELTIYKDVKVDEDWIWKNYDSKTITYVLVFEFKPEIKSYSEVIRQVNVYKKHYPADYFVITNSDISKFQSIFESQGIKIYNP